MVILVKKTLITIFLVVLAGWLLYHSRLERQIHFKDYRFTAQEANRLKYFPEAQYAYGSRALYRNDTDAAAGFFRQSVSHDILYMDGWLKLAEVEAAKGNPEKASTILSFTDSMTAGVFRWKWSQTLLAHELGMDDIFLRNVNYLLAHRKLVDDALQLLEIHFKRDPFETLHAIDHQNLAPYLKWLMRWDRVDDSIAAWQKITETDTPDAQMVLQFVNFLINKKRVKEAQAVWHSGDDERLMTNGGFEEEITRQAFDWRYGNDRDGRWKIERVQTPTYGGSYALEVAFAGHENISFHHLYQIVPVEPMLSYMLTYWWRSDNITTDQGPFFDIYSYDIKGLYVKGPMIKGTNPWHSEVIEFTTPRDCHAIVLRLRRLESHRFDSKMAGILWLDDFQLENLPSQMQKIH